MAAVGKAVIPAAGHGTRMRPVSRVVPKELLPVGTKPALQFALEEAAGAGLEEIAVVVSPAKGLIRRYVEDLVRRGELPARITWVTQEVQRGLGDAMTLCAEFVAGEPFALLLPDNVFLAPQHDFGRLVELHAELGRDVIGVVELGEKDSGRFGNCGRIEHRPLADGVFEIESLQDKLPGSLEIGRGERLIRTCGRYVCRPHVLEILEELRSGAAGELDEVPAYQRIIREHGAVGCLLPPPLFDVGNAQGFAAANAYLASRADT